MAVRVSTPDGATIEFPDGTDEGTISRVMRQAAGGGQSAESPPLADVAADVGKSALHGINKGLANLITAPYRLPAWAIEKTTGIQLPNYENFSVVPGLPYKWGDYTNPPEPQTTTGRYVQAAGEGIGSSAIPTAGLLAAAPRIVAAAPTLPQTTQLLPGLMRRIAEPFARRPGAAVAADVAASSGAGLGQEAAKSEGFGRGGQFVAGMMGAFAPLAVGGMAGSMYNALSRARAGSTPYARVANKLGDMPIDDLSEAVATGATTMNANINTRALEILGEEMVRVGGNRQAAIPATVNRIVQETGVAPQTAQDHLRRLASVHRDSELFFGEYPTVARSNMDTRLARNAANVTDEAAGAIEDVGTHWLTDTIASGSGASASGVRNAVMERMGPLREQFRERLGQMAPGGRTIQDADQFIEGMTRTAQREYDAVYHAPGGTAVNYSMLHGILPRIVERHLNRMVGRSDDQAQALQTAIDRLYTDVPRSPAVQAAMPGMEDQLAAARMAVREARRQRLPRDQVDNLARQADTLAEQMRVARRETRPQTEQILMPSLQMLQDMRGGIRGQIDAAIQGRRADIATVLQPLYRDITRLMERASPQWATANRRWADMNIGVRARELGEAFAERAGPRARDQMREFQRLAPEAQDLVRIEYVQKLIDKIDNAGDTHDLAKLFSTPHTRGMVRAVLGNDAAVDLARLVRDNRVATKSRTMLGGSPTQPRQMRQAEQDADLGLIAAADNLSIQSFKGWLVKKTMDILRERRNRAMAGIITTPMRDTPAVAEHLERMRRAQARQQISTMPTLNALGVLGGTAGQAPALD